jgi:hypothetical protein
MTIAAPRAAAAAQRIERLFIIRILPLSGVIARQRANDDTADKAFFSGSGNLAEF